MVEYQNQYIPVANYYSGKSIFLTGGTGFIGKVFIEKLLYTCKDLDKIYLLIREKQGVSPNQRLEEMANLPVFTRIKKEIPDAFRKIVPLTGDITEPNLGIRPEYEKDFMDKISVVFHMAASVKFDETLDETMLYNAEATRRVLKLCQRMNNLQTLVHLSTAYCHTDKRILEEVTYPLPFVKDRIGIEQPYDWTVHQEEKKFEEFKNSRPNTYTVAKAISEALVAQNSRVPTVIIRPSAVCPSISEPMPGWIDSWNGATTIITTTAKGLNHVLFGNEKIVLDMIPVDYVSNLCIVAAARCDSKDSLVVYNSCSSSNPITIGELFAYLKKYAPKTGINDIRSVYLVFVRSEWALDLVTFLLHKVPAYVMDSWRLLKGKKPRMVKFQSEMIMNRDLFKPFTSRSYPMRDDNVTALSASLSSGDRALFPFDPKRIQWNKYIFQYCKGIKKYLLRK